MSLESSKKTNLHLHDDAVPSIDHHHESRPNRRFSAVDMSEIALALDDNASTSETVNKLKTELAALLVKSYTDLVNLCQTYGIDDRPSTTSKLHEWLDVLFHTSVQSIITPLEIKYLHFERLNTDFSKKVRDLEVQRSRLEKDLVIKTEKAIQLQLDLDNIGNMDDPGIAEYFNERAANQNKSLQQRLEQLVAVHRQLLRKFAALEVDNSEYKKKVQLRDERIKQLESNSRGLTGTLRAQAERHVTELTNLREQIQILKADHQLRLEHGYNCNSPQTSPMSTSFNSPTFLSSTMSGIRSVRGGGGSTNGEIKSVRGGRPLSERNVLGSPTALLYDPYDHKQRPVSTNISSKSTGGSFLSKLLGGK